MKRYGAARYIKEAVVKKQTGEVKKTIRTIDETQIKEDERYDGYYCIIASETKMTDHDLIDTYGGLWRIKKTFRVTKTELETRLIHVWTKAHIEAISGIVGARVKEKYYLLSCRTELTDRLEGLIGQNLTRQVLSKEDMRKI